MNSLLIVNPNARIPAPFAAIEPPLWAGLTAGLMALPIGWLLAYILIYFINLRSFGWSLQMETNPAIFVTALLLSILAALLAGIYPVVRLKNMEIAVALREE